MYVLNNKSQQLLEQSEISYVHVNVNYVIGLSYDII